jgi:hypothetical protein
MNQFAAVLIVIIVGFLGLLVNGLTHNASSSSSTLPSAAAGNGVAAVTRKCYAFDVTNICNRLADFDALLSQWRVDRWTLAATLDSLDLVKVLERRLNLGQTPSMEFPLSDDREGKWAMTSFLASRPDLMPTEAQGTHCSGRNDGWGCPTARNSAVKAVWPITASILEGVRPCNEAFLKYWTDDEAAMFALYGHRAWHYKQIACPSWFLTMQENPPPSSKEEALALWK